MKKVVKREMAKVVEEDFSSVFEIISRRRNRALMAVNVELLMTYWEIGAFLSPRIHAGSWDAAVVGRLADYLKRQDPTLRGYGKSNLYNMAKVYDVFSSDAFAALNERHQKQLTRGLDFFQSATGKSDVVRGGAGEIDIFQSATGKCLPKVLCLTSYYLRQLRRRLSGPMSCLPKRDKLDLVQASAIDFVVAQEGNFYIKGEAGTGKSVVLAHVAANWH